MRTDEKRGRITGPLGEDNHEKASFPQYGCNASFDYTDDRFQICPSKGIKKVFSGLINRRCLQPVILQGQFQRRGAFCQKTGLSGRKTSRATCRHVRSDICGNSIWVWP